MTRFRRFAPAILSIALAIAVRVAAQASPAPADVAIELNNNHVVVPVDWNGRRLSFLLDTGAPTSLIDLATARAAGVPLGARMSSTGAGPGASVGAALQAPLAVRIPTSPSPLEVTVLTALDMADLSAHAGRALSGILGADLIRAHVVEIDYEHLHLRFHDERSFSYAGPGATVPLMFENAFPIVRTAVHVSDTDAFDVRAILDVGASTVITITQPVAAAHDLVGRLHATVAAPLGRGVGGAWQGQLARLPGLSIGAVRIANLVAALAGPNAGVMSTTRLFEANIGGGLMRHFTMFFDYGRSRVIFEPNGLFAEPFEAGMSGLALTTEGPAYARVVVESVREGSPAAEAGITSGDRLVAIDGQDAGALTLETIRRKFQIAGGRYAVTLQRDGRTETVTLTTRRLI